MNTRLTFLMIFFLLLIPFLFSEEFNFTNIISFNIPSQFEILSYKQDIKYSDSENQYWYRITYEIVYMNKLFILQFSLFGSSDLNSAIYLLKCSKNEVKDYVVRYNFASELHYLLKNYEISSLYTKNGDKYSLFGSLWPSGVTSDFVGYYLKTKNNIFDECFVFLYNSWEALGAKTELNFGEDSFSQKLKNEDINIQNFYSFLDQIVKSLQFKNLSQNPIPFNKNFSSYIPEDGLYLATSKVLRLRDKPSTSSNVIGIVTDQPYRIVGRDKEEIIDGKKGNWVRITPLMGDYSIGWAFNYYLRKMTKDEENEFYYGFN